VTSRSTTSKSATSKQCPCACFLLVALFLWAPGTAFAYFDPNAGGLLYQLLFPLLVAVVATWRYIKMIVASLWQRILGVFGQRKND
jgi:hypothetical protein